MINESIEIQRDLSKIINYHKWIYEVIEPYLGNRILDVGCAIGNITCFFLNRELVVGLDPSENFVQTIKSKFSSYKNFQAIQADISNEETVNLKKKKFDTVTCLNVLEHIGDDVRALRNIHKILDNKGRLVLLVPAFKCLYGTVDKTDQHYRRYTKQELRLKLKKSGFIVEKQFYMNVLGIPGWYLNGKILKKPLVSHKSLAFYDRLVPVLAWFERKFKPPIGLSLITVCKK